MAEMMISPIHKSSYLTSQTLVDKRIDIFEAQITGWLIDWAKKLSVTKDAGFAALMIALGYFEGHAMFYSGKNSSGNSKKFFKEGFEAVFQFKNLSVNDADIVSSAVYENARCGLFHQGIARPKLLISGGGSIVDCTRDVATGGIISISINVPAFVDEIEAHFKKYIARLRDPQEVTLRQHFEQAWDIVYTSINTATSTAQTGAANSSFSSFGAMASPQSPPSQNSTPGAPPSSSAPP